MLDPSLRMKKNESISPLWPKIGVLDQRPGGGVLSFFSSYVGSGPASTVHPQKYQEFQAPKL